MNKRILWMSILLMSTSSASGDFIFFDMANDMLEGGVPVDDVKSTLIDAGADPEIMNQWAQAVLQEQERAFARPLGGAGGKVAPKRTTPFGVETAAYEGRDDDFYLSILTATIKEDPSLLNDYFLRRALRGECSEYLMLLDFFGANLDSNILQFMTLFTNYLKDYYEENEELPKDSVQLASVALKAVKTYCRAFGSNLDERYDSYLVEKKVREVEQKRIEEERRESELFAAAARRETMAAEARKSAEFERLYAERDALAAYRDRTASIESEIQTYRSRPIKEHEEAFTRLLEHLIFDGASKDAPVMGTGIGFNGWKNVAHIDAVLAGFHASGLLWGRKPLDLWFNTGTLPSLTFALTGVEEKPVKLGALNDKVLRILWLSLKSGLNDELRGKIEALESYKTLNSSAEQSGYFDLNLTSQIVNGMIVHSRVRVDRPSLPNTNYPFTNADENITFNPRSFTTSITPELDAEILAHVNRVQETVLAARRQLETDENLLKLAYWFHKHKLAFEFTMHLSVSEDIQKKLNAKINNLEFLIEEYVRQAYQYAYKGARFEGFVPNYKSADQAAYKYWIAQPPI
jgi:hypothetical protein